MYRIEIKYDNGDYVNEILEKQIDIQNKYGITDRAFRRSRDENRFIRSEILKCEYKGSEVEEIEEETKVKVDFSDLKSVIDNITDKYDKKIDKEKIEQTSNSIKTECISPIKPMSLEHCEELFKIDKKIWDCVKYSCTDTQTNNGSSKKYIIKAEFKKNIEKIHYNSMLDKFLEDTKNKRPMFDATKYKNIFSENLLEVPIADLHIGKLSWFEETGENFDHKIVDDRFREVLADIINRNINKDIDKVLYPMGNDILNYDNMAKTTTGGTPQDTDVRFQKMFNKACELSILAIESLCKIAPVDVLYVPSNHDWQSGYYLIMYLSAWFKNHPNVNIDISPRPRKYYRWGDCLIGYSHGSYEKSRLNGLMQIEAKEDWGETVYKEWHLAHLHSEHTREEDGMIIRNLSSITGTDFWHSQAGYIGAVRKTQSFLWNKKKGLLEIQHSNISQEV